MKKDNQKGKSIFQKLWFWVVLIIIGLALFYFSSFMLAKIEGDMPTDGIEEADNGRAKIKEKIVHDLGLKETRDGFTVSFSKIELDENETKLHYFHRAEEEMDTEYLIIKTSIEQDEIYEENREFRFEDKRSEEEKEKDKERRDDGKFKDEGTILLPGLYEEPFRIRVRIETDDSKKDIEDFVFEVDL